MKSRLKEILDERMINQSALARRISITDQTMSKIAQGKSEPTLKVALRIAKALSIPVEEIWQEEEHQE